MSILPTAAPSFDIPLEMLRACHGHIQAQQAAQAVLRYFDTAGHHHHEDEEHDLFPSLRATGNAKAIALTDRLLIEHVDMNAAWLHLPPCCWTWLKTVLPRWTTPPSITSSPFMTVISP